MGTLARERAREIRRAKEIAEQQRRQRTRVLRIGGLIIGGLVVAIVISLIVTAGQGDDPASVATDKPLVVPTSVTQTGAFLVGEAAAPVKLELYLDYMCPFCGRFERTNGGEMDKLIADGTVRLELHPLAFLDRFSEGTRYSTRSANAIVTVAENVPDRLLAFNAALFANQPEEGSSGLTNDQIGSLAAEAGVPSDVVSLFGLGTYEPWLAQATDAAFSSGITGTPTVKINGTVFKGDLYAVGPLTEAIVAAKAQG
jgi:protein-disulfide isomerase